MRSTAKFIGVTALVAALVATAPASGSEYGVLAGDERLEGVKQPGSDSGSRDDPVTIDYNGLRSDAAVIGEGLGIPVDEMEKYLELQLELQDLVPGIEKAVGDQLAGIWFDWDPGPVLVVAVTGEYARASLDNVIGEFGESIRLEQGAERSRKELLELMDEINGELHSRSDVKFGSYVDEISGSLVFHIESRQASTAIEVLNDYLAEGAPVSFSLHSEVGGRVNRGGRHLTDCTSGFTVMQGSARGLSSLNTTLLTG